MKFDKKIFIDYLKGEKNLNKKVTYLFNLYKTYKLTELVIDKYGKKGQEIIKNLEDTIYTVDDKILNEKERISYELDCIGKTIEKKNIDKECYEYEDYIDLMNYYNEINLNDKIILSYLKKQISILQSKLGLKNTFFIDAHDAFLELYRNIYATKDDESLENARTRGR